MSGFPGLPFQGADSRQIAAVVNRINQGKINCTGEVTLAAGAPTTLVLDHRAGPGSHVSLMPLTASAAAELAAGTLHVAARDAGAFLLGHAASAAADRRFGYALIG